MTREEAIALLNEQYETCKRIYDCSADQRKSYPNVPQFMEALGMALSALRPVSREQVQADKEGYCVELPCKLGEKLWCINSYGEVEETVATGFLIGKGLVYIYYREKMSSEYYNAPLGKILFLTREGAEKALEEEKNG